MNYLTELLTSDGRVSDYKINIRKKESYELFFVKGSLETVRCTDTCDKEVTVYVDHGEFKGDAQFFVYPSTTHQQLRERIDEAVAKAQLICNPAYTLPEGETGSYTVESNFADHAPAELAGMIAQTVFRANTVENAALNSVEIFLNKHTETVCNSRGLHKTQVRYSAMVEAIPTYNGRKESVELYEQYNFSAYSEEAILREISQKLEQVKARSTAHTPAQKLQCPVVLGPEELAELFGTIAEDLNYATVYAHANCRKKGDAIQGERTGDPIGITMAGEAPGSTHSRKFDGDGLSLGRIRIVDGGKAVAYYGSNRYGQYLGETPTGDLRCICVDAGTATQTEIEGKASLEILSMSGLQVDLYNDYIGGEIRLAYYRDGNTVVPVTGISVSGSLSAVLNTIRLSDTVCVHNSYSGPEKAILTGLNIF